MAQLIGLNVYAIGRNAIPAGSTPRIDFPFAGMLVRAIPGGQVLSTGTIVYSTIQILATGAQYSVVETAAAIAAAS